jgi:plasmid stabilization system protein ParE
MAGLVWLNKALVDAERLHAFLKEKNPDSAMRAAEVIRLAAHTLRDAPYLGKSMGEMDVRREYFKQFGSGAYVLRYKVIDDKVIIIRVWHSRELRGR